MSPMMQGKPQPSKPKTEKPRGGYSVDWPDLNSLSDQEKATVGATKTTGLAAYIAGGCSAMVPEHSYLTEFLGFRDEEADAMLEEAARIAEKIGFKHVATFEDETYKYGKPCAVHYYALTRKDLAA